MASSEINSTHNSANFSARERQLRDRVLEAVAEFYEFKFARRSFVPGQTPVPVSGKVFGESELINLVDSSLDFWLMTGRYAALFEERFAEWIGVKHCLLVNSGSSANLLALRGCLKSKKANEGLVCNYYTQSSLAMTQSYPSDLTDNQWSLLEALLPSAKPGG
jgi:CDP-6-deoxy-D-xylo-4-hexulose-3-dehydrase